MNNKKKIITLITTLALIAAVGIGATLAYLSDTTKEKENTFTVGKIKADLEEYTDGDEKWNDEEDGKNMYPGQSVTKKPVMSILKGSANCYAFMKVEGVDALIEAGFVVTSDVETITKGQKSNFSADWKKVNGENGKFDGVYQYVGKQANADHIVEKANTESNDVALTAAIFDKVTYAAEAEGNVEGTVGTINVKGAAIQADGLSEAEALEEVNWEN